MSPVILDSTTLEEANSQVKNWLRQRSRWIKGYMQTYLVHMRNPVEDFRKGRLYDLFTYQVVIGSGTAVLFINPLMWVLLGIYTAFGRSVINIYHILFPWPILYLGAFCLIFGNFFYVYLYLLACMKRKQAQAVAKQSKVRDLWLVATILTACITSVVACRHYFQQHEVLLYGDALSHMRSARSVFDSATPGLAQLGTVWLPLPHILMWPFIWNNFLWYSGLAGSFVSMPCYVIAAIYLFLSARRLTRSSRASFIGTLLFIFNPNVLYLQSTPLSETVCMAASASAGYYFLCWVQDGELKQLIFIAGCTFLATIARYDGWALFLGVFCLIPLIGLMKRQKLLHIEANLVVFSVLGGLGIALWFAWNQIIFGDPLSFQDGPYSSLTQQAAQLKVGKLFTYHNIWQAIRFYTIDASQTIGIVLLALAAVGFIWFILHHRFTPTTFAALVFLMPLPFYLASLYSGNAIIWMPGANPPGASVYMYNVRYGAQMVLPAALFISILVEEASSIPLKHFSSLGQVLLAAVILVQSFLIASQGIISLQEGQYEYACIAQRNIVEYLAEHYDEGKILENMFTTQVDPVEFKGNFKSIIYEGSGQLWLQALNNPANSVEWILVNPDNHNDPVAQHINVNSAAFMSQFTLVIRQNNGILLYHRLGSQPLPDRPAPPSLKFAHHTCT